MIKKFIKKFHHLIIYGNKSTSKRYIKYLRKKGISIGENVTFHDPKTNYIDDQMGFLITIGNNVEITRNVIIITHDYSWSVLKQIKNEVIGSRGTVEIGNNVFIGMNTIIMKNVNIGDNVIIGANSVINKNIPDNMVVAGCPAKIICSIDEYYLKRKKMELEEAYNVFKSYYKKYNTFPKKELFREFFWIFEPRTKNINSEFYKVIKLTRNEKETIKEFYESKPLFNNYNEFVKYCIERAEK